MDDNSKYFFECFGDRTRELNYFYHWICQLLNHPYKKPRVAILVHSYTQGIGKSAIGNLLMKLVGLHYSYKIDQDIEALVSEFNGPYRCNKIFTFVDEIPALTQSSIEKVRGVISELDGSIHFKNKDCYNDDVFDHLYITSQHPPFLNRDERRLVSIASAGVPLDDQCKIDLETINSSGSIQSYIGRKLSELQCYYSGIGIECFCKNDSNCNLETEARYIGSKSFVVDNYENENSCPNFMLYFLHSLKIVASNNNFLLSSLWISNKWIVENYKCLMGQHLHGNINLLETVRKLLNDSFRSLDLFKISIDKVKRTVNKKQIQITTGLLHISNFNDISSFSKSTSPPFIESNFGQTINLNSDYMYSKMIENSHCESPLIFSEYTYIFNELEIKKAFHSLLQNNF